MTWEIALLFTITILPIVFSPGPDILYVVSQGVSSGCAGSLRATVGILLGYSVHAILVAFGFATIINQFPDLLVFFKWLGVAYLSFLAIKMLLSARVKKDSCQDVKSCYCQLYQGFFTSCLNPKGLLMYFAILPNFIVPNISITLQALILSSIWIFSCAVIYSTVGICTAYMGSRMENKSQRYVEVIAGVLLIGATINLSLMQIG